MSQIASETQAEQQSMLNQIRSWEQEINQLSSENGDMVSRAASQDLRVKIDQFENRFKIELGRLDSMKHNIKIQGAAARGQQEIDDYREGLDSLRNEFAAFKASLS